MSVLIPGQVKWDRMDFFVLIIPGWWSVVWYHFNICVLSDLGINILLFKRITFWPSTRLVKYSGCRCMCRTKLMSFAGVRLWLQYLEESLFLRLLSSEFSNNSGEHRNCLSSVTLTCLIYLGHQLPHSVVHWYILSLGRFLNRPLPHLYSWR